jgi:hypothetical protein
MAKRKSKKNPAADPDDRTPPETPPEEPAEAMDNSERTRWELLYSEAGLPPIGDVINPAQLFAFATRELAILARLAPDLNIKLAASQFLFREFNTRPGGLTEKEEFIVKLKREMQRVVIEEDAGEVLDLATSVSGTARLPAAAPAAKEDPLPAAAPTGKGDRP